MDFVTLTIYFYFVIYSLQYYIIRDAKDAVYSRDGYDYDGYRLRVEFPRGRERGPGGVFKNGRERESRRGQPTRRSNYRVKVTGKFIFENFLFS